jgi:predicted AlkP superfamily phosphohydrolase/phosphomutase
MVDWSRTKAFAEGGHAGRVFLNLRGEKPLGIVDPAEREHLLYQIAQGLRAIPGPDGRALDTQVFRPEQIYRECRGTPPDLIVYLGNLDWRAVGSLGTGAIHVAENDTGPDHANHTTSGVFVARVPGAKPEPLADLRLLDCGPAILSLLGCG